MGPDQERERAREAALKLLRVRDRSAAELGARLRQKGFGRDAVDVVLERLTEVGLLDDARFAERFAADAAAGRGFGSRKIRAELLRRGVPREVAAAAATTEEDAEEARAFEAGRRRGAALQGLPAEVRARRLTAFLARRGYDRELCERVTRQVLDEAGT